MSAYEYETRQAVEFPRIEHDVRPVLCQPLSLWGEALSVPLGAYRAEVSWHELAALREEVAVR